MAKFVNLCQDSNGFTSAFTDIANAMFRLYSRAEDGHLVLYENWQQGSPPPVTPFNCANLQGPQTGVAIRPYGAIPSGTYQVEAANAAGTEFAFFQVTITYGGNTTTTVASTNQSAFLCMDSTGFLSGMVNVDQDIDFRLQKKDGGGNYQVIDNWTTGVVPFDKNAVCANQTGTTRAERVRPYGNLGTGAYKVEARKASGEIITYEGVINAPTAETTTTVAGATTTASPPPAATTTIPNSGAFAVVTPDCGQNRIRLQGRYSTSNNKVQWVLFKNGFGITSRGDIAGALVDEYVQLQGPGNYSLRLSEPGNDANQVTSTVVAVDCSTQPTTTQPSQTTTQPGQVTQPSGGSGGSVNLCTDINCFISAFTDIDEEVDFRLYKQDNNGLLRIFEDWTRGSVPFSRTTNCTNVDGAKVVNRARSYGEIGNGTYHIEVRRLSNPNTIVFWDLIINCTKGAITPVTTTQPTGGGMNNSVNLCQDSNNFLSGFTNINEDGEFKLSKLTNGNLVQVEDWTAGVVPFSSQINCINIGGTQVSNRVRPYGNIGSGTYRIEFRTIANRNASIFWDLTINTSNPVTQPGQTSTQPTGGTNTVGSVNLCQDSGGFLSGFTSVNQDGEFRLSRKVNGVLTQIENWTPSIVPFNNQISCVNINGTQPSNRVRAYGNLGSGDYRIEFRTLANPSSVLFWDLVINTNSPVTQPNTTQPQTTQQQTSTQPTAIATNDTVSSGVVGQVQLVNLKQNDTICSSGVTTFVVETMVGCSVSMIDSSTGIATVTPTTGVWSFNYAIHCNGLKRSNTATVAGVANGNTTVFVQPTTTQPQYTTQPPYQTNPNPGTTQQQNPISISPVGNLMFACVNNEMIISASFRNHSQVPMLIGSQIQLIVGGVPNGVISSDSGVVQNSILKLTRTIAPTGIFTVAAKFAHVCNVPINSASICIQL